MKKILFEQLPPELFELFTSITTELTELKRMIQEGEIGVAISEAEFNLVKERVSKVEGDIITLTERLDGMNITPEQVNVLLTSISELTTKIGTLETQDKSTATSITAITNRINTLEMANLNKGLRALTVPAVVTEDIVLPTSDEFDNIISWMSSDDDYLTHEGSVTRPAASTGDKDIALTATLTSGANVVEKVFTVKVKALELSNAEKLDIMLMDFNSSIFLGEDDGMYIYVTEDQSLPTMVEQAVVSWTSSNEAVFGQDGKIVRSSNDESVELTAYIVFEDQSRTFSFNIMVKAVEPEVMDYTKFISDFRVDATELGFDTTVVYDDLSDERIADETVDGFIQVLSDVDDTIIIDTMIKFDGSTVGIFPLSMAALKEGITLSSIFGQEPKLLKDEESHNTDVWSVEFDSLEQDIEVSMQYHIAGIVVKDATIFINGLIVDPVEPTEPPVEGEVPTEPTEPPTEPEPVDPEPTEPVEPEVPTEPTEPEVPVETEPEIIEPETEPELPVEETPTEPVEEPKVEPTTE